MTERNSTPTVASFDELAKALARGTISRRRALQTLGAGLFGGTLGSLALSDEAEGKKKKRRRKKKKNNGNDNDNEAPAGGNASANCRDDNDQCGSNANDQGSCRRPAAADNQGGFVCSSDQPGNICDASTQCGANTRCVDVGNVNECRVVVN